MNPKCLKLSPRRLFGSRKYRSIVTKSDPTSFSSGMTSSSSSSSSAKQSSQIASVVDAKTPREWSEMYEELVQAFKTIDRNNDGMISRRELEPVLKWLGSRSPSEDEATMMMVVMMSEIECDFDKGTSIEALVDRIGLACNPAGDDELRDAFQMFDIDRDGRITANELFEFFSAMGDEHCTLNDCSRMIAEVCKNGNGFVCFDDFTRMMELKL